MGKNRGETFFHHSVETPMVPEKPAKKKRSVPVKNGIEADYVTINRHGGKHPVSSQTPEVDQIDIDRHKALKNLKVKE